MTSARRVYQTMCKNKNRNSIRISRIHGAKRARRKRSLRNLRNKLKYGSAVPVNTRTDQ